MHQGVGTWASLPRRLAYGEFGFGFVFEPAAATALVSAGGFGTLGAPLSVGLGDSAGAVCSGTIQKTATTSRAAVAALAPSQIFFFT